MREIKFLHCADIHIGASLKLPGDKAQRRRTEILLTFERIMQLAAEKQVDFVLIAGDLFDSNRIENSIAESVFRAIAASKLPVIAVAGNHDPLSANSPYKQIKTPNNLYVFGESNSSVMLPELPVKIFGRSFSECYLIGEKSFPLSPADDCYNILLLHGDTSGIGNYNPITPDFIENCGMDYLALGHIHARTEPAARGKTFYAYPGCPEGQGFDEIGEKGVYIGTLGAFGCKLEFASVCRRRFEKIYIDISGICGSEQLLPFITDYIKKRFGEKFADNFYKIILTGSADTRLIINTAELSERLSEIVYFAVIKDRTTVKADYEALASQPDLGGIFTKKMLKLAEKAVSDEEREKIMLALDTGLRAFDSEVKYREAD